MDELILNPDEVGFVIMVKENKKVKYIGSGNTEKILSKEIQMNIDDLKLNDLKFFKNDTEVLPVINEILKTNQSARLMSAFRVDGYTIIESDDTDDYIRLKLIDKKKGDI